MLELEPTSCEYPGCMKKNEYFLERLAEPEDNDALIVGFYYCYRHASSQKVVYNGVLFSLETDKVVQNV